MEQYQDVDLFLPDRTSGRRSHRLAHYQDRYQIQEVHLLGLRLSLYNAILDAGTCLEERLCKLPGRNRNHRHAREPYRHLCSLMVRLWYLPLLGCNGNPLCSICLYSHRWNTAQHGCKPRRGCHDSEGRQVENHKKGNPSYSSSSPDFNSPPRLLEHNGKLCCSCLRRLTRRLLRNVDYAQVALQLLLLGSVLCNDPGTGTDRNRNACSQSGCNRKEKVLYYRHRKVWTGLLY